MEFLDEHTIVVTRDDLYSHLNVGSQSGVSYDNESATSSMVEWTLEIGDGGDNEDEWPLFNPIMEEVKRVANTILYEMMKIGPVASFPKRCKPSDSAIGLIMWMITSNQHRAAWWSADFNQIGWVRKSRTHIGNAFLADINDPKLYVAIIKTKANAKEDKDMYLLTGSLNWKNYPTIHLTELSIGEFAC